MSAFGVKNPIQRVDIYNYLTQHFFFSIWVFFHKHSLFTGQGKGEGIFLTPLYHFHQLHRNLHITDYCRELTSAHSQQPDSNWEPLVYECKSLTTKLHFDQDTQESYFLQDENKIGVSETKEISKNQRLQITAHDHIFQLRWFNANKNQCLFL